KKFSASASTSPMLVDAPRCANDHDRPSNRSVPRLYSARTRVDTNRSSTRLTSVVRATTLIITLTLSTVIPSVSLLPSTASAPYGGIWVGVPIFQDDKKRVDCQELNLDCSRFVQNIFRSKAQMP